MKSTPGGNQYFILFIDDYSRYVTVKLMKNKASVKQQLMNHCQWINNQYGRWPKEVRADNAAEYEGTRSWQIGVGMGPEGIPGEIATGSFAVNITLLTEGGPGQFSASRIDFGFGVM